MTVYLDKHTYINVQKTTFWVQSTPKRKFLPKTQNESLYDHYTVGKGSPGGVDLLTLFIENSNGKARE